jgi:hypothetical protein
VFALIVEMRLLKLHKLQRERRQQLAEKENRLHRTLLTVRENSARALQLLGVVGTLHEALLLTNTDICAELESANPTCVFTRNAISQASKATDSVQQSNEVLEVWDGAIRELVQTQKVAFHANMTASQAVTQAFDEHTATEKDTCMAMATEERDTHEHMEAHIVCAYCQSNLDLKRAVGFGICTACAQVSWDESWETC